MFGWSHPKNLSVACDRVNVLRLASPLGVGPIARPGPTTTDESPDQTDRRDLGTVGTASDRSGRGLETGVIADFRLHRKCAIQIGVDNERRNSGCRTDSHQVAPRRSVASYYGGTLGGSPRRPPLTVADADELSTSGKADVADACGKGRP